MIISANVFDILSAHTTGQDSPPANVFLVVYMNYALQIFKTSNNEQDHQHTPLHMCTATDTPSTKSRLHRRLITVNVLSYHLRVCFTGHDLRKDLLIWPFWIRTGRPLLPLALIARTVVALRARRLSVLVPWPISVIGYSVWITTIVCLGGMAADPTAVGGPGKLIVNNGVHGAYRSIHLQYVVELSIISV